MRHVTALDVTDNRPLASAGRHHLNTREVAVGFLFTELEAGAVFAKLVSGTNNRDKRNRNRANAQTAYRSLRRFIGRVELTDAERQALQSGLQALQAAIRAISPH